MRYQDFVSLTESISLITRLNRGVESTVENFITSQTSEWRNMAMRRMRRELGYHPVYQRAAGFKTFDQESFRHDTHGWDPSNDGILADLSSLLPLPTEDARHPMDRLLNGISLVMTNMLQDHLRREHGDVLSMRKGLIMRRVGDVRVSVSRTRGAYQARYYNDKVGPTGRSETLIEIIVNDQDWNELLQEQIHALINGDGLDLGAFSHQLVNSFMHEYAHLEQDLKGTPSNWSLIPGRKGRGISADDFNMERYIGQPLEIDAHAAGAAAEVVNSIISRHAKYQQDDWSPDMIPDRIWNNDINWAISGVSHGKIPYNEYLAYISGLDRRFRNIDPDIKDKFLRKVRQRFIKSYIIRLRRYLRSGNTTTKRSNFS